MASSFQSQPLPAPPKRIPHPLPGLEKKEYRVNHVMQISARIRKFYPDFVMRIEYLALILLADPEQFNEDEGSLSIKANIVPTLKQKLEYASPFCKHYMLHLDSSNIKHPTWAHALYKAPVQQANMSAEDDHKADWETIARSIYYDSRFGTNPNLPIITGAPAEIEKAKSRDKGKCVVTEYTEIDYLWLIPATWNNSPAHNDSTGNLEGSSVDLADVDMLDSDLLNASELGKTHKSWNIMCIDKVLYSFITRGWGGFRFEENGRPNNKGVVEVKLRFYWMPQMTGRFNRRTTKRAELVDMVNEFNAFHRAGCPPPPTYPKGHGFVVPKSGQLVVVERNVGDVDKFKCALKIHWRCVLYTALCGGAGRPQFMTGMDQSFGHLKPRDNEFAQQKAELEENDLVAQMSWRKLYQPSSDSGYGGSGTGSSSGKSSDW